MSKSSILFRNYPAEKAVLSKTRDVFSTSKNDNFKSHLQTRKIKVYLKVENYQIFLGAGTLSRWTTLNTVWMLCSDSRRPSLSTSPISFLLHSIRSLLLSPLNLCGCSFISLGGFSWDSQGRELLLLFSLFPYSRLFGSPLSLKHTLWSVKWKGPSRNDRKIQKLVRLVTSLSFIFVS